MEISKSKQEYFSKNFKPRSQIDKFSNNEKIFIIGDFNSRIDNIPSPTLRNNLMRILSRIRIICT
jgi:hypothetical protein